MTGHLKRKRLARQRKWQGLPISFNVLVLCIALTLGFLERITTFFALVPFGGFCEESHMLLYGKDTANLGAHGTLIVAACLLIVYQLLHGAASLAKEKALHWQPFVFGVVNVCIILAVLRVLATSWAFFHPFNPVSDRVHENSLSLVPWTFYEYTWERPSYRQPDQDFWTCIDENDYGCIWYNEELGLTQKDVSFFTCIAPEIFKKNWEVRTDLPLTEPGRNTLINTVYFDENGAWIKPDHEQYPPIRQYKKAMAEQGIPISPLKEYEMYELLYQQYLDSEKAKADALRPYTLEEIQEMVAETWARDMPGE